MSPNPYPLFKISEHDKPTDIEGRIKRLIRLYVAQPTPDIANAVVAHINAILAHPKYITNIKTRCQLRHLAGYWRCLAWSSNPEIHSCSSSHQTVTKLEMKQVQYFEANMKDKKKTSTLL